MSEIRTYLEAKAALPEGEWLRREPRGTHPEIKQLVAEFRASGGFYDDDAERFVNEKAGDLPPHERHGSERDRLLKQLGNEVYLAKGELRDDVAAATLAGLVEQGFEPLDQDTITEGGRYLLCIGTLYCGQTVPSYSEPVLVRARHYPPSGRFVFLPKGARTRALIVNGPALVKAARG